MAELLTEKIIIDALEADGISQNIDNSAILELIQEKNNSNLDITSSWAEGHEDLLLYVHPTADSYEVYVCTKSHDKYIDIEEDVFYYFDGGWFTERIMDALKDGLNIWVESHIYDDIEHDLQLELEDWYHNNYFNDKKSEMKERLLSTGNYKI
tara:strand:+ start:361 stop:819 length:459 start_codon:yes stop_codon:yes gene_type:complete